MNLNLQTILLGEDKQIEFQFETLFLVLKDETSKILKFGQLTSIDRSKNKNGAEVSVEMQLQEYLKEFKAAGCKKEHLAATVVSIKEGPSEVDRVLSELQRFGIKTKSKWIASNAKKIAQINQVSGEIFLSKGESPVPMPNRNSKLNDKISFIQKSEFSLDLKKKTKVLIVEDSKPIQKVLSKIFSDIPNVEIVAIESRPEAAVNRMKETKPDFITLDMHLEEGTGADFLRISNFKDYAKTTGARCVLVTDCSMLEGNIVFDALANGASSYIQKPQVANFKQMTDEMSELISELFLPIDNQAKNLNSSANEKQMQLSDYKLIAIGSSTGGTEIVRELIGGLPVNCPPIVVVQHMPSLFTGLYAERIQKQTGRITQEVRELTPLLPGQAYIAAGGTHLLVEKNNDQLFVKPKTGELVNRFMPSVSVLFGSIEKANMARHTVAIMLTGMGSDGAKEMRTLKDSGSFTIGQSKESCVVYGMPRAAEEMGALCWSGSPDQIIYKLNRKAQKKSS